MRYNPALSVTDERIFSINAGLAASTVTPGVTAPDESRTTPVRDACAKVVLGIRSSTTSIAKYFTALRMEGVSFGANVITRPQKRQLQGSVQRSIDGTRGVRQFRPGPRLPRTDHRTCRAAQKDAVALGTFAQIDGPRY